MVIRNKLTGDKFGFSARRARLRRVQRRVKSWAETLKLFIDHLGRGYRLVMITLTYTGVDDWKPGHIRDFMLSARKRLGSALLAYAWVAELQRRGAVHYHVLFLVKAGTDIPKPDTCGWWLFGSTRIETARTPFYILTYTGKEYQKSGFFPKGLRMFAVWIGEGVVDGGSRWLFRLSALPGWLETKAFSIGNVGAKFRRVPGGGWDCEGEHFQSPWEVVDYG